MLTSLKCKIQGKEKVLNTAANLGDASTVGEVLAMQPGLEAIHSALSRALDIRVDSDVIRRAKVVELLIQHGANVNHRFWGSRTLLHIAANAVQDIPEVIEVLLRAGADLNSTDKENLTALQLAIARSNLKTIQLLVQRGATIDSETLAEGLLNEAGEQYGHVEPWLVAGADVETRDKKGNTALHIAAGRGHFKNVPYLISQGANVNATNKDGWTALMQAAFREEDYPHIRDYTDPLMAAGADLNARSGVVGTALMLATARGHLSIVEHFLTSGANPNLSDDFGRTALMLAAHQNRYAIAQKLLLNGADPNATTKDGGTALITAAREELNDIMSLLLKHGATINHQAKDGTTALFHAAVLGRNGAVALLLERKADASIVSKEGLTALEGARRAVPELLFRGRRPQDGLIPAGGTNYQYIIEILELHTKTGQ